MSLLALATIGTSFALATTATALGLFGIAAIVSEGGLDFGVTTVIFGVAVTGSIAGGRIAVIFGVAVTGSIGLCFGVAIGRSFLDSTCIDSCVGFNDADTVMAEIAGKTLFLVSFFLVTELATDGDGGFLEVKTGTCTFLKGAATAGFTGTGSIDYKGGFLMSGITWDNGEDDGDGSSSFNTRKNH